MLAPLPSHTSPDASAITWAFETIGTLSKSNVASVLPAGSRGVLYYQGGYVTAGYFLTAPVPGDNGRLCGHHDPEALGVQESQRRRGTGFHRVGHAEEPGQLAGHGVVIGNEALHARTPAQRKRALTGMDLVRLAIPRRVYTQSHVDYVAEVVLSVFERRAALRGLRITYEAPYLRHFTARMEPL